MAVYHQMGHDSWNLVEERSLPSYKGLILSPVNSTPDEVVQHLASLDTRDAMEVVLDPQLYEPRSSRGKLVDWGHFSPEQDSVDPGSVNWWKKRNAAIVKAARDVGANSVASPSFVPKAFGDEYYELMLAIGDDFADKATAARTAALLTAIVPLRELGSEGAAMRLASVWSRSSLRRLYVIFHDELYPRTQRTDFQQIAGAIQFLNALRAAGVQTLVAFCGIDLVVWKAGRANDVATGKYFNLRRFDPARWGNDAKEGRVKQYWTDGGLLTWLREEDFRLLDSERLIDRALAAKNPYSVQILDLIDTGSGKPWLGTSWRQYLHWFQDTEKSLEKAPSAAREMLDAADKQWAAVQQSGVLMIDRDNDGRWIRAWLNGLRRAGV